MIEIGEGQINIDLSLISSTANKQVIDCLIVCNSEINHVFLQFFVSSSRHIILCDGGANHFYNSKYRNASNVRAVVGDLDSVQNQVRGFYFEKKVQIKDLSADQDTNDLQKSINYAIQLKASKIVCIGVLGGRIDQEMCNLHLLQKYSVSHKNIQFIGIGKQSLVYFVKPQIRTAIKIGNLFIKNQVGLICFRKARVETKGFKWNLGKQYGLEYLQWGVLISSSNEIVENEVSILASHQILFTIEF